MRAFYPPPKHYDAEFHLARVAVVPPLNRRALWAMLGAMTLSAPTPASATVAAEHMPPPAWLHLLPHALPPEAKGEVSSGIPYPIDPGLNACVAAVAREVAPSPALRTHLALVAADLSNLAAPPRWGEWNAEKSMYAASIAKAGVLVAAHQLRHDLQALAVELAARGSPLNADQLFQTFNERFAGGERPHVEEILSCQPRAAADQLVCDFKPDFVATMTQMIRFSNNQMASRTISSLGFNYINSTLWQTGLFDPAHGGGLWVGRVYGRSAGTWHRDPLNNLSHSVNARALGRIFARLGRGELVDKDASTSMQGFFANSSFPIKFIAGFRGAGYTVNSVGGDIRKAVTIYRKSGTMPGTSHDAALVERSICAEPNCLAPRRLRYVIVAMTEAPALTHVVPDLALKLDLCIRQTMRP